MLVPLAALKNLAGDNICPLALWNVVFSDTLVIKDRSNQNVVAEHILSVKRQASWVVSKVDDHCSHYRHADLVCLDSLSPQIRHELALELCEEAQNVAGFLIEKPWHSV